MPDIPAAIGIPIALALVSAIGVLWFKYVEAQNARVEDEKAHGEALREMAEKNSAAQLAIQNDRIADNKVYAVSTRDMVDHVATAVEQMNDFIESQLPKPPRRPGSIHDK